jgi:hypothetical protein
MIRFRLVEWRGNNLAFLNVKEKNRKEGSDLEKHCQQHIPVLSEKQIEIAIFRHSRTDTPAPGGHNFNTKNHA